MSRLMKGWEVEWCANVPKDEFGENYLDNADYRAKDFETREAAIAFAESVLPKDWFGSVRVTPFEMVPYELGHPGLYAEFTADPEYIESASQVKP